MSSYVPRGQGYPSCFLDGGADSNTSSSWSFQQSPPPPPPPPPFSSDHRATALLQNQNSIHANQTLEDAFARLSLAPTNNNYSFLPQRSGLTKSFPFEGYGRDPLINHRYYNGNDAVYTPSLPRNYYCLDRTRPRPQVLNNDNGSYGGLMTHKQRPQQQQPQRVFPRVPFSNEGLCYGFQRKSNGGVMMMSGANNNMSGFSVNNDRGCRLLQQSLAQCCVYDLKGKILALAKDQVGCRILQEMMKSLASQEEVSFVFSELIGNVVELMFDASGNYVFQKLVEICTEEQRTSIILMVTKTQFQLVNICLDVHGTRAVQKLVEHVTTQEQRNLIVSALCPGTVALTTDANGLHVIEHCLKHFSDEENKYLLNIVAKNCFEIATDRSGCCVIQHCVDHAHGEAKEQLMNEIIVNASLLADDCYGNYVVQHLVSLKIPRVVDNLLRQLENKFFSLSCNKYGSNVVEKFFSDSEEEHSAQIILELLCNPNVSMLLVDPFGNYVIRSALSVSKGHIQTTLSDMVEHHSHIMRNNLYGKKLLGWFEKWKRQM